MAIAEATKRPSDSVRLKNRISLGMSAWHSALLAESVANQGSFPTEPTPFNDAVLGGCVFGAAQSMGVTDLKQIEAALQRQLGGDWKVSGRAEDILDSMANKGLEKIVEQAVIATVVSFKGKDNVGDSLSALLEPLARLSYRNAMRHKWSESGPRSSICTDSPDVPYCSLFILEALVLADAVQCCFLHNRGLVAKSLWYCADLQRWQPLGDRNRLAGRTPCHHLGPAGVLLRVLMEEAELPQRGYRSLGR